MSDRMIPLRSAPPGDVPSARPSRCVRRGRTARLVAVVVAAVSLGVLGGCTPLYLPPVPAGVERGIDDPVPDGVEVLAGGLERNGAGLRLRLDVSPPPAPGYLAVQWFDPTFAEVAAQSVWLEAAATAQTLVVDAPEPVGRTPGRWRAVVSDAGGVVRQFDLMVDAVPGDGG